MWYIFENFLSLPSNQLHEPFIGEMPSDGVRMIQSSILYLIEYISHKDLRSIISKISFLFSSTSSRIQVMDFHNSGIPFSFAILWRILDSVLSCLVLDSQKLSGEPGLTVFLADMMPSIFDSISLKIRTMSSVHFSDIAGSDSMHVCAFWRRSHIVFILSDYVSSILAYLAIICKYGANEMRN
jgi:hypothetical protein